MKQLHTGNNTVDGTALLACLKNLEPWAIKLRRDLHLMPEIAFQEERTAARIREELSLCGVEILTCAVPTAVTARIQGRRPGPVILVREDIDALPMQEDTGLPFSAQSAEACHSCGHDIHTASLLLLAKGLKGFQEDLAGTVLLAFQPAEETASGAKAMFAAGFGQRETQYHQVIGFHTDPGTDVGKIGVTRGMANASTDIIHIQVCGEGGHGAHPYRCADPVVTAAYLITALQTVVSRENPALEPAVLTFGSIHGGTAENIIPTEVSIGGTLRTFNEAGRRRMWESIRRITAQTCEALRAHGAVEILEGVPVLCNDEGICDGLLQAAEQTLGPGRGLELPASPGSDDFSCFSASVPGVQFRVGTGNHLPESRLGLHNPRTVFDEGAILTGAAVMGQYILNQLA